MKCQTILLKQFFGLKRCGLLWSHSNGDIFTCEDNMLFSHVKISSFRAKDHLVFHCCLYNKTDFLTFLSSLMLFWCFEEKQKSFSSGDFWALARWQVTHFQFLSVFQDGGHVKFSTLGQRINVKIPTQGKALSVNFPWVTPPPPFTTTLGLNIDSVAFGLRGAQKTKPTRGDFSRRFSAEAIWKVKLIWRQMLKTPKNMI